MSLTSIELHFRVGATAADEHTIEQWKASHPLVPNLYQDGNQATLDFLVKEVKSMVRRALSTVESDHDWLTSSVEELKNNKVLDVQGYGSCMRKIFANQIKIID